MSWMAQRRVFGSLQSLSDNNAGLSTNDELREGRRKLLLWNDDERPEKRMKSVEHNKTKGQVNMMGVQLWKSLIEK